MSDRPILVSLIGGLSFLCGLLLVIFGVLGYLEIAIPGMEDVTAGLGIGTMVVGLFALIVGYGFLKGWAAFWYLGVIVYVIVIIGGAYSLITEDVYTTSIIGILIAIIILAYLFSSKVKSFFLSKN